MDSLSSEIPAWHDRLFAKLTLGFFSSFTALCVLVACLIPLSPWTILILCAICASCLLAAQHVFLKNPTRYRPRQALFIALIIFLLRPLWVIIGSPIDSVVLPSSSSQLASLNWVFDEHDLAMLGAWGVTISGAVRPLEAKEMLPAMQSRYIDLALANGPAPTPLLNTLLFGQTPERFDTLVVHPPKPTKRVLIFLHGYGSNFTLPCWHVAQAAKRAGFLTLCPSTTFDGRWQSPASQSIVQHTIQHARNVHNAEIVILSGLSAGSIGASVLAPRLKREIDGLVLLSGVSPRAKPVRSLPTLIVHGKKDSMTPFKHALSYRNKGSKSIHFQPVPGRHFALLAQQDYTLSTLEEWLQKFNKD